MKIVLTLRRSVEINGELCGMGCQYYRINSPRETKTRQWYPAQSCELFHMELHDRKRTNECIEAER